MRSLALLAIPAALLIAGCGSSSTSSKVEVICITANQELRSLVPRVNQAEKAGLDQTANLRAMSRTTARAAGRLNALELTPGARRFAGKVEELSRLYAQAAAEPGKAAELLAQAEELQASSRTQARKAGLKGCGGMAPGHTEGHSHR